jgi:gamma-glutamyltranspeptidase/glutathione hydrolase
LSSAWIADGLALPDAPGDPLWAHLLVEASKQAGRDRPEVLHDGADGDALLSTARLEPRRRAIDPDHASSVVMPARSGDTTALCVVDGDGVGVSLIQSNAFRFGSHSPSRPRHQPAQPRPRLLHRGGHPRTRLPSATPR